MCYVFIILGHLFRAFDGETIALDWLTYSDVVEGASGIIDGSAARKGDKTPIVIVIPGLTSDSTAAYVKHLAFNMARQGWSVVVCNHHGLGGVSLTRVVGAAAICSPWDLLVCDRFINRRPMQKVYDRVLTVGLQGYAQLHQSILSRLVNWEGVEKSSSLRDFDNHATRILGKFETVDMLYRRSSSTNYVENVSVPLLCVSALDDPVCTSKAIPWDECRVNENIVLATTPHGGHLAFYEGITASSI